MAQNKEFSAMKWYSNLEEGHVLSRGAINNNTWMFDFDYSGVTSFVELNRFEIVSKGVVDKETHTLTNPIKVRAVLDPSNDTGRAAKSASFFETINQQMYSEARKSIENTIYGTNGYSKSPSVPDVYFSVGNGKTNTLGSFPMEDFIGSALHEDMISRSFLGTKKDIVFDKKSMSYVHKREIIPEAVAEATEEVSKIPGFKWDYAADGHERFLEKLSEMTKTTPSMHTVATGSMADFLETITFKEASQIENMSPEKVKARYPAIREMVEGVELDGHELQLAETDAEKILGVEAPKAEKEKLAEKIKAERLAEKQNKELSALKSNITFLHSDRRENIGGDRSAIPMEDQLQDLFKSMNQHRKDEEESKRYIEKLRAATHTQDEDGNWHKNDKMPNRNADRLRQAISVDMNPATDSSGIAESINKTVAAGRENYQYALDNIERVQAESRAQALAYGSDFEESFNRVKTIEEMESLATEKVNQYRLWSQSVAAITQWKDRNEVEYILGEGKGDHEYIDKYMMSKRLEAFSDISGERDAKYKPNDQKVDEYFNKVFDEIKLANPSSTDSQIKELTQERIDAEIVTTQAKVKEDLLKILPTLQKKVAESTEIYHSLRTDESAKITDITDARKNYLEAIRVKEETISRTFFVNFNHLQKSVSGKGYELQSSFHQRTSYPMQMLAEKHNVPVSYFNMSEDELQHISTYQKLKVQVADLDEQINSGTLTGKDLEGAQSLRDSTSTHINAILEDIGAQSFIEEKKVFDERYAALKELQAEKNRLESVIINKGYETDFSKTIYDENSGVVKQVGISKETYDQYFEDPEKLVKDMEGYNQETSFARENTKIKNRQSWQRALADGTIVKGDYNDNRGYIISEINPDTGIAYVSRPTVSIQSLDYSLNVQNKELLENIGEINEAFEQRMTQEYKVATDYNQTLAAFEDLSDGHITVVAELPVIEKLEEAVTPEERLGVQQRVTRYLLNDGEVKNSGLPEFVTKQLDGYILSQEHALMNARNEVDLARESLDKLINGNNPAEEIEHQKKVLRFKQEELSSVKSNQGDLRKAVTETVLADYEKNQVNKIVKRNERVQKEIALFGFEQGKDEATIRLSRDKVTRMLIGNDERTNRFYENLISSHFPHLRNSRDNLTGSVGESIMAVINDHVSQQTDFDLRDDSMVRRYMQSISPDTIHEADLSQENQQKLKAYKESLGDKTLTSRLQDFLFSDIIRKSAQVGHSDDSNVDHAIKLVYNELRLYGPEADITGQSIYSFIHNQESATNKDAKRTYQARILQYSPEDLNGMLQEIRSPKNVSSDKVTIVDERAAKALDDVVQEDLRNEFIQKDTQMLREIYSFDGRMAVEPEQMKEIDRLAIDGNSFAFPYVNEIRDDVERLNLDLSDLKPVNLERAWPRMIKKNPQLEAVRSMIFESGEIIRDNYNDGIYSGASGGDPNRVHERRAARLSLYAIGTHSGQEAKYRSLLKLEDLAEIFPRTNMMKEILSNKDVIGQRQLQSVMQVAENLGKKVEVKIPIEGNGTVDGFLRFNGADGIEAYSPSLDQVFAVTETGKSQTVTVNTNDTPAYSTENRIHSMQQHARQEPILKYSMANEEQVKRFGQATVLSNVDASIGNLVDFVEQNQIGISYDIETTTTNPKKIGIAVQPIEIFAQQLQVSPETGELLVDEQGRYGVNQGRLVEVTDPDGSVRLKLEDHIVAKEFHAIVELDAPTKSIIQKIAADPDYFNVNTGGAMNMHIASYNDAILSAEQGLNNVDLVKHITGETLSKSKSKKLLNELLVKSEEFRLLQNVAKYKFGAEKSEADIQRFGIYSDGKAVDNVSAFKSHMKDTDRAQYNKLFDDKGTLKDADDVIQFNRKLYEHQSAQTATLVADAMQAAKNLSDKSFDYGAGVKRYSLGEALEEFNDYTARSKAKVIIGQNAEKADNKTMIDSAKNVDRVTVNGVQDNEAYASIKSEISKVINKRDELFQSTLGSVTSEYDGRFGVNPVTAMKQKGEIGLADTPKFMIQDAEGKFGSAPKTWVSNVSEALEMITEHTGTTVKISSDAIVKADESIGIMSNIIDKLTNRSGELTDIEMAYAKDIGVFDGNEHEINTNTKRIHNLADATERTFSNLGMIDQQIISRGANPSLTSQSNASVMDYYGHDTKLAHDGKVDTNFTSSVVGRFAKMVHDHLNGVVTEENAGLSSIISGMDKNRDAGGSFMERNAYKGDGNEFVSFIQKSGDDVQKGVYRLTGFDDEGTTAFLQRVAMGTEGVIDDTSVDLIPIKATTNSELAHTFAKTLRFVETDDVADEISSYVDDISDRHFKKILNNDFSYDSHMNQIRELELEGRRNNPLFDVSPRLLDADVDQIIQLADEDGKIQLQSNPIERARQEYASSFNATPVTITDEQKSETLARNQALEKAALEESKRTGKPVQPVGLAVDKFEDPAIVDDVTNSTLDRTLLRNGGQIGDTSKEKFYNKKLSKEQVLSLQEMNDFNHTGLGVQVSDMMDNLSALNYQGNVSVAEKANILSGWNEELKAIAKEGGYERPVRNAYEFPEFSIDVKNPDSNDISKHVISGTINTGSPVDVANSLKGMARKVLSHIDYENAENMTGLKEDRAINAKILPQLRELGVIGKDEFMDANGKSAFIGLGDLSNILYSRIKNQDAENPLLKQVTSVDYMGLAKGISDGDLERLQNKANTLMAEGFSRQTDIQKLQFNGLIESRREMKEAGMYIPGMKLNTGSYSDEDVDLSKRYSSDSFLKRMSSAELTKTADFVAGSARDIDKDVTRMIYSELMSRAAYNPDGRNSINPNDIIASGNRDRIDAALAMNWIKPFRDSNVVYEATDTAEHRIGYGQFAGTKLGDMSERVLNNQASYALENRMRPDYETQLARNAYMQQQEAILDWRKNGYEGRDQEAIRYNTARGEAPRSLISNAANEQIKEEFGNERRNPTPEPIAEPEKPASSTKYFMNDPEKAEKYLRVQPPVSSEDLQMRTAAEAEITPRTFERTSALEDYITQKKGDISGGLNDMLSSSTGKKWIAGLGVAAAALFAANSITSPLRLESRPAGHGVQGVTGTPEDDTNRSNKQAENQSSLQTPNLQTGGTSYVTSGEKGYTIKASGKAPSNIDSSQLQSTINNSMNGASNVNINLRDDRSTLDGGWLESQFSNFIERGSV